MQIEPRHTDSTILSELGRRLARTRLERNLTQQQLATEAGVSRATVDRLERGEPIKSTSLVRVLRVLGRIEALDRLVPEPLPSPVERLKLKGRRRQRARGGDPGVQADRQPWAWGDG